jgi:hypothetical protein
VPACWGSRSGSVQHDAVSVCPHTSTMCSPKRSSKADHIPAGAPEPSARRTWLSASSGWGGRRAARRGWCPRS